jgi:hypothetical protein
MILGQAFQQAQMLLDVYMDILSQKLTKKYMIANL